jgi:hypothetical protein
MNMKKVWIIVAVVVVVVAVGIFAYLRNGSTPNPVSAPTTPGTPAKIPVPDVPIPASSYGKDAVGATSTAASGLLTPQPTEAVGILEGATKLASGSTLKITSVQVSLTDPGTNKVIATTNLGADGTYKFTVLPGEYIVNVVPGTGSSPQLPKRTYVGPNETIDVPFSVK